MTPDNAIAPERVSPGLSCPYAAFPVEVCTVSRRDIERTIAIKAHEDARVLWRFHVKQCAACTGAVRDQVYKRICDEGWPLASGEARTRVTLENLREQRRTTMDSGQEVLF